MSYGLRWGEETRYGTIANILTMVAFTWLLLQAIVKRDLTAIFPLCLLGILLIHYIKTQRIMYPYTYEEEEATLEFKESDRHKAIHTLSGIVHPNVEGWKLFDSTHNLPEGGTIREMGETYEGFDTLHYKEPGFSNTLMIIRVLKTPLEKGLLYPFSHWMEMIDCYPGPKEDYGIKIIIPIKKEFKMTLIFGPNQIHKDVKLQYSKGERTICKEIPFNRFILEDGRVKYTGIISRPKIEGTYLYTWSW